MHSQLRGRRQFLGALGALAATLALDPEKALWVPNQKTIFIPKPAPVFIPEMKLMKMNIVITFDSEEQANEVRSQWTAHLQKCQEMYPWAYTEDEIRETREAVQWIHPANDLSLTGMKHEVTSAAD